MVPINKLNSPENFGYPGTGNAAPFINKCIEATGECFLNEGTYIIGRSDYDYTVGNIYGDNSINWGWTDKKSGIKLVGSGIDKTILKLADDVMSRRFWGKVSQHCIMLQTSYYESCNDTVISDITWDGNYQNNYSTSTLHAIGINGNNNVVQNCKFINFGVGDLLLAESFVIFLNVWDTIQDGGKVLNCYFTNPTGKKNSPHVLIPENTFIGVVGRNVEVRGNTFENCLWDKFTQQSPNHGITLGGCTGAKIIGNTFINFQGSCIYNDSWKNTYVEIADNTATEVWGFIQLSCQPCSNPDQVSDSSNYTIHRNQVKLSDGLTYYAWDQPTQAVGSVFIGFSYPDAVRNKYRGFDNVVAEHNVVTMGLINGRVGSYTLLCVWPWEGTIPEDKIRLVDNRFISPLISAPSAFKQAPPKAPTGFKIKE